VADVRQARTAEEHAPLVRNWATNVWEAYRSQHDLAHAWITAALAAREGAPPKQS
jgi:hypothetical protein